MLYGTRHTNERKRKTKPNANSARGSAPTTRENMKNFLFLLVWGFLCGSFELRYIYYAAHNNARANATANFSLHLFTSYLHLPIIIMYRMRLGNCLAIICVRRKSGHFPLLAIDVPHWMSLSRQRNGPSFGFNRVLLAAISLDTSIQGRPWSIAECMSRRKWSLNVIFLGEPKSSVSHTRQQRFSATRSLDISIQLRSLGARAFI